MIILTIIVVVLTLPMVPLGYVVWRMSSKGQGFAPGWQARCSECGTIIPAGEIPGVVRVHTHRDFKSVATHRCDTCEESRTFHIEYTPKD